jgi:hypothetical protein
MYLSAGLSYLLVAAYGEHFYYFTLLLMVPTVSLLGLHLLFIFLILYKVGDRLFGLVVRLPGCRRRGPGFDSRRCQIFCVAVGLEKSGSTMRQYISYS